MTTSRIEKRQYRAGIIKPGLVAACVVAATAVDLYLLPVGRTCKVRKIHIMNNQGAPVEVTLGTGLPPAAFAPAMPPFFAVNGMELPIREEDIQDVEFVADITVQATAAGAAPNDVQVQVTVEEYLGPTG